MAEIKLANLQKDVLRFIGQNSFGKNFYWTGGTLLSYFYLSHRFSEDLDFFSDDIFQNEQWQNFMNELKNNVKAERITETLQMNRRIYNIERGKENVKLEFVYFPFPAIEKRAEIKEFNVKADSLQDIMVNKTQSVYHRNEPKDAYDLYWYLIKKSKYDLAQLVKLVEKKFGIAIEPMLLMAKINELSDNLKIIKPFLKDYNENLSKEVKKFFQKEFNRLAKKKIK